MRQTPLQQPAQAHGPTSSKPPAVPSRPTPPSATPPAEVRYPFGVQNDFGQVILSVGAKDELRPVHQREAGATSSSSAAPSSPPPPVGLHPHSISPSRLSLQSGSLHCSLASSTGDLSIEAAQLERAIRTNDTLRVKRFLDLHHDKFQVNLHGSILDKTSSCESQSQDVEILLRKSKTLIDRLDPVYPSDGCSSSSLENEPHIPLIFTNALHVAVEHGAVDVVRLLLKYGLEPNQGGRLAAPEFNSRASGSGHGGGSFFSEPLTTVSPEVKTPGSSGAPPFSPSVALTPPSPGAIAIGVPQQRRVSWVSPAPSSRSGSCKKRRAALKSIPRQRSFSLESDSEFLRPGGEWQSERRSVSLKSSPLMSPRPQGASPPARSPAPRVPPPPVKQIPERSIFAELRRSSEIFKSILLNLSMKETDSGAATDQAAARDSAAAPAENQVDLAGLLAAHEKRRLNQQEEESSSSDSSSSCPSSCSASSLSSPDDDEDEGGAGSPRQDDPGGSLLRLNPNLPPDKVVGMAEVYTRQYLFTLPALFLAVVRGNATLVYLLLKYGAAVNFQDGHGNTALHLAVCQATVPWECVLDLVERGAQISLKNRAGVRAADLAPSCLLARLQDQMLSDCWSGLGAGSSSASTMLAQNAASSVGTDPYGASAPPSAASTGARSSNPARILRKLRTSSGPTALRTESTEEASSASVEMLALSSTGSVRSRASKCSLETGAAATSNNNNNNNKETSDMLSKQESRRRAKRKAWKDSRQAQASVQTTEKNPSLEAERSFQILHHMADNPECLGYLLRGLLAHISSLLLLLQKLNETSLHRSMAALLHNVLKTAIETYGIPQQPMESEEDAKSRRKELSAALCLLLKVCLSLIHGVHDLQYTAMVTINKVIDACVVHRLTHVKVKASEALQHPCNESSGQASDAARSGAGGQQQQQQVTVSSASTEPAPPARPSGSRTQRLGAKRLGSVWRHAAGEHLEQVRKALTEDFDKEESVIDVLSSVHALSVVNILHNSLTLYKRVVGSKQQCSPSQR